MSRLLAIGALALTLLCSASQAAGEDTTTLDEEVVTATREATALLDTPLPADVLTSESIDEVMAVSPGAAIEGLPGVSLNSPAGLYFTNPSIRGLGGRRVVVLVDGRRVDAGKPIGVSGYFLNLADADRIEVVRGPGSVLYGSDALGGVIQVISEDPLGAGGVVGRSRTVFGTNNREVVQTLQAGYGNDRGGARATAVFRRAGDYTTGGGTTIDSSYYEDRNFALRAASVVAPGHVLRVSGDLLLGGPIGRAANDLDDEKRRRIRFPSDNHYAAQISYDAALTGPVLRTIRATAYVDQTDRELESSFYSTGWSRLTRRLEKTDDFLAFGATPCTVLRPVENNRLVVGLDGHGRVLNQDQSVRVFLPDGTSPAPSESTPIDGATAWGAAWFAKDEHRFGEKWILGGGVRWDSIWQRFPEDGHDETVSDGALSGTLGVVYHPRPAMSLTFNLGRAYRAPTIEEKFVESVFCKGVVCGAKDVTPETSLNADLGFKGLAGPASFETYGFANVIDDYITLADAAGDCDYVYTNVGRALLAGGEARVSLDFPDLAPGFGLRPWVSASYVYGEDIEDGVPLPQIPPLGARLGLRIHGRDVPPLVSYHVDAVVRVDARQDRVSPAANVASQPETETGAFAVGGASAGFVFGEASSPYRYELFFRVENVADTAYRDHLSTVEAPGRNAKAGLAVRFR